MKQVGNSPYFIHENELYKKVPKLKHGKHMCYYLTNKIGARKWYKCEKILES